MSTHNKSSIWYEKYKPHKIEDMVLPQEMKAKLQDYVNREDVPNLGLWSSEPGCLLPGTRIKVQREPVLLSDSEVLVKYNLTSKQLNRLKTHLNVEDERIDDNLITEMSLLICSSEVSSSLATTRRYDKEYTSKFMKFTYWLERLRDIGEAIQETQRIRYFKDFFEIDLDNPRFDNFKEDKLEHILKIQFDILHSKAKTLKELYPECESSLHTQFWVIRGYTEDEAQEKISNMQSQNAIKLHENIKKNPEKYEGIFNTSLQYWTNKGYSEKEAQQKLKDRQTTFSLDKCIEKYGQKKGILKWEERQEKWQETLYSKTQQEIDDINARKTPFLKKDAETKEEFQERLQCYGCELIYDSEDLEDIIISRLREQKWAYFTKNFFVENLPFYENSEVTPYEILEEIGYEFPRKNQPRKTRFGYNLRVPEGLLRSLGEIEFYGNLKARGIQFRLDEFYTNSKQRFDFLLSDYNIFVEIQGLMDSEKYRKKMQNKHKKYNSLIVLPDRILEFFEDWDNNEVSAKKWSFKNCETA